MTPITLEYTWTKAEAGRAFWHSRVTRLLLMYSPAAIVVGIVIGGTWLIWCVIYAVLQMGYVLYFRSKVVKNTTARGAITTTFDDEGVTTGTPTLTSRIAWPEFTRATDTSEWFELYRGDSKLVSVRVPKRAFTSAPDEATVRSLLEMHTSIARKR